MENLYPHGFLSVEVSDVYARKSLISITQYTFTGKKSQTLEESIQIEEGVR
jgi:hypothetical protein